MRETPFGGKEASSKYGWRKPKHQLCSQSAFFHGNRGLHMGGLPTFCPEFFQRKRLVA